MKPSTREWIKKVEGDYQVALALSRSRKHSFRDAVCFHCQQSAEKYLKARLEEADIFSPKTHDLKKLLHLLLPVEPLWSALQPALDRLTGYAVNIRYPGDEATPKEVKQSKLDAKAVPAEARMALGLKP
jgi:HEPN domain-containing protein